MDKKSLDERFNECLIEDSDFKYSGNFTYVYQSWKTSKKKYKKIPQTCLSYVLIWSTDLYHFHKVYDLGKDKNEYTKFMTLFTKYYYKWVNKL